jgi:hypothetical protein
MSLATRAMLVNAGALAAVLVLYMARRVKYVPVLEELPAVVRVTRPFLGGTKENHTEADSPELPVTKQGVHAAARHTLEH